MDESVLFKILFKTFWKSKNDFFHVESSKVASSGLQLETPGLTGQTFTRLRGYHFNGSK